MENNQQIDRLFQDAFKELPLDTPTGDWDTPAPSNWSAIEQKMQVPAPTSSAFSYKLILALVSGITIAGIAFFLNWNGSKDTLKIPDTKPTQSAPPQTPAVAPAPQISQEPTESEKSKQQKSPQTSKQTKIEKPSDQPIHNNLERRRQKAQQSKE